MQKDYNLLAAFFFFFSLLELFFTMGSNLSKALNKMFGTKEMRILMLGLDAAGKTSKIT